MKIWSGPLFSTTSPYIHSKWQNEVPSVQEFFLQIPYNDMWILCLTWHLHIWDVSLPAKTQYEILSIFNLNHSWLMQWRSRAGVFNQWLWITCCIILRCNSVECRRNPTQRNAFWVAQQAPGMWEGDLFCATCGPCVCDISCVCCWCANLTTGEVHTGPMRSLRMRSVYCRISSHKIQLSVG